MISFEAFRSVEGMPIYLQMIRFVKQGLAAGRFLDGDELPSRRLVSATLAVNPNTVQKAYAALEMNGVLYTVAGRGAFISPEEDQLSQFKKLAADRFAAAVQAAADAGLTRQELEQIVEEQMERRDRDD